MCNINQESQAQLLAMGLNLIVGLESVSEINKKEMPILDKALFKSWN